jgi:hypothetical protein
LLSSWDFSFTRDQKWSRIKLVKLLKNFGKSISSIEAGEVDKKWYCVGISPLLIEPYQGRTYIKHLGRFGPEKPLHLEHFVEYISDGYECYIGDPASVKF